MFKVKKKESSEIFTVYAVNGTSFLTYDQSYGIWLWTPMESCEPLEEIG